jgi:hypothetical protein
MQRLANGGTCNSSFEVKRDDAKQSTHSHERELFLLKFVLAEPLRRGEVRQCGRLFRSQREKNHTRSQYESSESQHQLLHALLICRRRFVDLAILAIQLREVDPMA